MTGWQFIGWLMLATFLAVVVLFVHGTLEKEQRRGFLKFFVGFVIVVAFVIAFVITAAKLATGEWP
jgi:hypothetical protein